MGSVVYIVRQGVELLLTPFDALPPWLGLTLLSLLSGIGMLWVVGKTTSQKRLETARDRMASTIYEVRLFLDSPRRVILAQGRMITASALYIAYVIPAFVVLALPLGLLYLHLEPRYGLEPLDTNKPLIVTVDLADGQDGYAITANESASKAVRITAPPVVDAERGHLYLRAEIGEATLATLALQSGDQIVTKRLAAGDEVTAYAPDRSSGLGMLLAIGHESPIPDGTGIEAIHVAHPAKPQNWLGIGLPWWLYWLLLATAAALALRRPMGVVL